MQYKQLPYIKNPVSRILFGTAMSPFFEDGEADHILDAVYEMGITSFDTARRYGLAERSLGRWVEKNNLREKLVILSKCAHHDDFGNKRVSENDIREDLEISLNEPRTNHIDIYLLHRDDPEVPAGEIVSLLNELHEKGHIGAFGASNWSHERIAEANAYAKAKGLIPMTISSPNFSLAEQVEDPWGGGCISISGPKEAAARAWYLENDMPVFAYSSLAHGLLSGRVKNRADAEKLLGEAAVKGYASDENFIRIARAEKLGKEKGLTIAQVAMAYLFNTELDVFAIVSSASKERMQANIAASEVILTKAEMDYLDLKD